MADTNSKIFLFFTEANRHDLLFWEFVCVRFFASLRMTEMAKRFLRMTPGEGLTMIVPRVIARDAVP
jgi:hypothetical protein